MISRPKQVGKMEKTEQRSLEERLDHLTTTVEAQQKLLDRFMALYESEKLQSLPQRGHEEKQKQDMIVAKDAQLEKMRREIVNMKLSMERQTAIYVRDKMTWEQERDQLQKELERYKALSQGGPTNDYPCPKTTVNKLMHIFASPTKIARKSQVGTKDLSKSHKCTDCNEFSTDLRSYLEFHRSVGCKASPRYDCTVCQKQFLRKDNYDRHLATHANKDIVLHQIQGIEAAFGRNKRRQAIREEYQLECNMLAEPKEKKQSKQVGVNPLPDAFVTYDFETLDMNLKGTMRNMKQMRQLEPLSVPAATAGQKQADSPKVEQIENVEAGIEITKKTLYNLLQNSTDPASAGLLATSKLTVDHQAEQNEDLSPSVISKIKVARRTLSILAPNSKLSPIPYFAAVKKQPTEQKVDQNEVFSPSNKAEIKMTPKTLWILKSKTSPLPAFAVGQKQTVKRNEVLSPRDEAEIDKAAKALCYLMGIPECIPVSVVSAGEKQTVNQQVKQDVVLSSKDEDNIKEAGKTKTKSASKNEDDKSSSALTLAAPSTAVPASDFFDNIVRQNLRQRFVALLMRHPCTDSTCSILAFRGYVEHLSKCVDGPDCSWYICKRVHAKSEHLKTCRDKLDCTFCQPYICFNDNKMQGMVKVLEKGCPLNQNSFNGMSESTREAIMTMVARLAVNYGLVGDDEKSNNGEDDETPDEIVDVEALSSSSKSLSSSSSESSSSSSSSSDEGESSDEENASEGEMTSEEWEIVEAERRQEVDQTERSR